MQAGGACSSGGVYVGHYYRNWTGTDGNSNGRYRGMAVGTSPLSINVAATEYGYDSFGNVTGHVVGSVNATRVQSSTFTYDEQNRITSSSGLGGNGQSFTWQPDGRLTNFNGNLFAYNAVTQTHAVNTAGGFDLFDYNPNGSMSVRYKGTGVTAQTLRWDSRNQLAQVTWGSPQRHEYYGYDEGGRRVTKAAVSGGATTVTFYPFAHFEQTGSSSAGVVKYYFFGGERFAMRTGSGAGALRLLFKDRISSTVHVTDQNGNTVANTGYYPFGATVRSTGTMPTDRRFTDQQLDGTGLYYYGSRYYDPNIGHFISPDTLVPDPAQLIDYQRYLYARGNPLKYNDPSGHCAVDLPTGGDEGAMQEYTECWQLAGVILSMYDNDPWWQEHFKVDQQTFLEKAVMQPTQDAKWMRDQLDAWEQDFKMRTGLLLSPVKWEEPTNLPVKLLGQDMAEGTVDDSIACAQNWINCSPLLDDAALGASTVAFACGVTLFAPCAAIASRISTGLGTVSTFVTIGGVIQQSASSEDLAVSVATTYVGATWGEKPGKSMAVGFAASFVQWLWDQKEQQ